MIRQECPTLWGSRRRRHQLLEACAGPPVERPAWAMHASFQAPPETTSLRPGRARDRMRADGGKGG